MLRLQRPWIKICGLAEVEDVDACYALGANAVGFIVVPNTHPSRNKDQLLLEEAATLIAKKTTPIQSVILARSSDIREIENIIKVANPDYIQIQSDIDHLEELVRAKVLTSTKFIKKIGVDADKTLDDLQTLVAKCASDGCYSMFLLDTALVVGGKGGTGSTHDWALSAQLIRSFPGLRFIVAGGLGPKNVRGALDQIRPWGVDVMTAVSSERGLKDRSKIAAFVYEVNQFLSSNRQRPFR
jgi:phosphoribosylanthranilate isomerase